MTPELAATLIGPGVVLAALTVYAWMPVSGSHAATRLARLAGLPLDAEHFPAVVRLVARRRQFGASGLLLGFGAGGLVLAMLPPLPLNQMVLFVGAFLGAAVGSALAALTARAALPVGSPALARLVPIDLSALMTSGARRSMRALPIVLAASACALLVALLAVSGGVGPLLEKPPVAVIGAVAIVMLAAVPVLAFVGRRSIGKLIARRPIPGDALALAWSDVLRGQVAGDLLSMPLTAALGAYVVLAGAAPLALVGSAAGEMVAFAAVGSLVAIAVPMIWGMVAEGGTARYSHARRNLPPEIAGEFAGELVGAPGTPGRPGAPGAPIVRGASR